MTDTVILLPGEGDSATLTTGGAGGTTLLPGGATYNNPVTANTWLSSDTKDTLAFVGSAWRQPYLDGTPVSGTFSGASAPTITGFSTTQSNDVIVIIINTETNSSGVYRSVTGITGGGLTWLNRSSLQWNGSSARGNRMEVWYAIAASPLSSVTFTATLSGSVDDGTIEAFGVAAANTTTPWDANVSLPATATDVTGLSTTPTVSGISTSNVASSFVFGAWGNSYNNNPTTLAPGTNYTGLKGAYNTGGSNYSALESEYQVAQLTSASATFMRSVPNWGMIVDAIQSTAIAGATGTWSSTEAKDALAFVGGVLGGSWHSTETDDAIAFTGHPQNPIGTWASTEAADVFAFASPAQGAWNSTEAKDAMAFIGHPELYGTMVVTETTNDAMAITGGVLGGSWDSAETTDIWTAAGHLAPRGTWASTEGTDTPAITGDILATFFNPLTASPGIDFQSNDLTIVNQQAFDQAVGAKSNTTRTTGKYYAEFTTFLNTSNSGVGIGNASADFANWGNRSTGPGPAANGAGIFAYTNGSIWVNGIEQSNWPGQTLSSGYLSTFGTGQLVSVAIDLDNNLIWFRVNGGRWNGITGADPAHGIASPRPPSNQPQSASGGYDISAITGGPIYLWAEIVGAYDKVTMNPGTSAFAYAVPAGFLAWDSALPISAPLQIDGYATGHADGGPVTSATVTLSTTQIDDVIVLGIVTGGYWHASTVDHITSTTGLVWKRRNQRWGGGGYKDGTSTVINSGRRQETWWAHAPAVLTAEDITVHMTVGTGSIALVAFGVSGANYTTPWDTHTQAGGYVEPMGHIYYFPDTAELSTKAANTFLFGFHGVVWGSDAGVTQEPWTYVASASADEHDGYNSFLSLVYQVVEEPQINTNVVAGDLFVGVGNCYTASGMMFDSIVAADETGTDQEIVWYWDSGTASNCLQLSTGTTLQLSYSAINFNLMVLLEVAIMSASGTGTVTSISESQGSLTGAGFQRRSRTTTHTPLGPLAVEIWWGWTPGTHGADRPHSDTITINTANMGPGDIIGAKLLGLGGSTGAWGLGDPFWDVNPAVPAGNGNNSGSPPPYATDISTTIPSDLVVAWTANNTTNVPGYTDPFVSLVQAYPRTVTPTMQLNSIAPPFFTGFEYYYEPGLATNETAEFLQTPEPNGWIVVADAIPVGPPQPPSGTMHTSDQQDKFTHTGDYSMIGIVGPGGWVVLPAIHGTMAATDREDINGGTPNLGYSPFLGEGWLGWVAAHAAWDSTDRDDQAVLYGWVLGFGITGQLGAVENKDRLASGNRTTRTGTWHSTESKDRWGSEGLVLPSGRTHPTPPFKRRLLIIT